MHNIYPFVIIEFLYNRKLSFLYLANDVVQNVRKNKPEVICFLLITQEYRHILNRQFNPGGKLTFFLNARKFDISWALFGKVF